MWMRWAVIAISIVAAGAAGAQTSGDVKTGDVKTGPAAFGDWRQDMPGVRRLIRPDDLPPPRATPSASSGARIIEAPGGARLAAPPGFSVTRYASGLEEPRTMRFAPNGDLFVAETGADRIAILRPSREGQPHRTVFARGLGGVFGLTFYPASNPRWIYASTPDRVVRFAYSAGDDVARGAPQVVVDGLPDGGHSTRDIIFSRDGRTLYVAVGSQSNVGAGMGAPPADLAAFETSNGFGAAWGGEKGRADVLAFDPEGGGRRVVATGLRNCVAMALRPVSDDLWCVVNERDALGDDLPPDYATQVQAGAFYGWPWFYIGAHPDPRYAGARADLASRVTMPDVLLQPHSAPLGIAFYDGEKFPADYRGDAFVALHGSWNRAKRTGYKIVRLRMRDGKATGEYEDFVTGFVVSDAAVWGRPVSVAVGPDGALYFSDDRGGAIWRVEYDRR